MRRRCRAKAICAPRPCAPKWAPITCARSASPASKAFSAADLHWQLEDAGDGAIAAHSSTRSRRFLGNDIRRKLKPLRESRWAHDPFARGAYSHALPGHAANAPCWPRRSMDGCSLRAKRPRRTSSPPRMARGNRASVRLRKCWRHWRSDSRSLVIASTVARVGRSPTRDICIHLASGPGLHPGHDAHNGGRYSITRARVSASGTKHVSYLPKMR